jgi:hypothetical protein
LDAQINEEPPEEVEEEEIAEASFTVDDTYEEPAGEVGEESEESEGEVWGTHKVCSLSFLQCLC